MAAQKPKRDTPKRDTKSSKGASAGHWAGSSRRAATTKPRSNRGASGQKSARWVASVTSDSTHPPQGLFTKDAATIARTLATKKVSPKGPTSGLRMLIYFMNRAGKGLSRSRRAELERAKTLLSERIRSRKKSAHRSQ